MNLRIYQWNCAASREEAAKATGGASLTIGFTESLRGRNSSPRRGGGRWKEAGSNEPWAPRRGNRMMRRQRGQGETSPMKKTGSIAIHVAGAGIAKNGVASVVLDPRCRSGKLPGPGMGCCVRLLARNCQDWVRVGLSRLAGPPQHGKPTRRRWRRLPPISMRFCFGFRSC